MIQSFNLRRTAPAKPTGATGPPTSVKVSAILEKANAIRQVSINPYPPVNLFFLIDLLFLTCTQAVGSDDGEDNWSDT